MNEVVTQDQKPLAPMVQFKRDLEAVVAREMDMLDDKAKSRMKNAMIVAVTKDPDLLLADRASIFMAARMCASHGVVPDGVEATIQTYNTKVKDANGREVWIKKATYLPMIRGIVNRVERSGKIKPFHAEVVYDGEAFTLDLSHGDRRPSHTFDPMRRGTDDKIVGAYSVARYSDGVVDCEVMPRAEIDKVMAVAKTKNVWTGWYSEKAKVAVMKRHAKRLPLSAEDMDFILNRDEADFDQARDVTPQRQKDDPNLAQLIQKSAQRIQEIAPEATEAPVEAEVASDALTEPETQGATSDAPYRALAGNGAPGSAAWDHGVAAFEEGKPITDCPYDVPEAKGEAEDWCAAWVNAEKARQ